MTEQIPAGRPLTAREFVTLQGPNPTPYIPEIHGDPELDEAAIQAFSDAGAFCGACGFEPGGRGCPDCERVWANYVAVLRAAGWAPRTEVLDDAADLIDRTYTGQGIDRHVRVGADFLRRTAAEASS